ncbi:Uncharacterized protein TCM_021697 [Theobroma cacao]|uniref:Uncharacterized protein n=1 Tax=Theobroma cacao TaxID=3641 RepID=A0A061EQU8_THECC|nr:Uncharacterized protein TCM_021697 [Theobroma cacao]
MASNAINTRVLASKNALADQRNGRVGEAKTFDFSLTGASSRSCKYVLTTLMQKILKFYESDTMERLRISFGMKFYVCCKSIYKMAKSCLYNWQHTCFVILQGLTMLLLVLFPSIPPLFFEAFNFRPLIAMEKAVDFLWNEEALLLLAKQ